jgi:Leucine-rich repeat (LRR) protein
MNHPIFGDIASSQSGDMIGRAQLPFFAGFDIVAAAPAGARQAATRPGEVGLHLVIDAGHVPTARQEAAYAQFLQHRDAICQGVLRAVFDYYQAHWGSWRSGDPTYDLALPELHAAEGLNRVIRPTNLFVFDDGTAASALLGFCFACTWDGEHGLGVLVRDGRVIAIGENQIAWSGPDAGSPYPLTGAAARSAGQQQAIAASKASARICIARAKALGAVVTENYNTDRPTPQLGIDFKHGPITDSDLGAIRDCPNLGTLNLAGTQVTDVGLQELRRLEDLETLDLSGTRITEAGLQSLCGLKRLKRLHLAGTALGDVGVQALIALESLAVLNLANTNVSDAGVADLPQLRQLQHLELAGTAVTDAGLLKLGGLQALVTLDLGSTAITDAGLHAVPALKSLRYLTLSNTQVTDASLVQLSKLPGLRTLKLQGVAATDRGVAELQRALPKVQIMR